MQKDSVITSICDPRLREDLLLLSYVNFSAIISYENMVRLRATMKEKCLLLKMFVTRSTKWMMNYSFLSLAFTKNHNQ